jgi:exodeoxyribonuclease VII large subunit
VITRILSIHELSDVIKVLVEDDDDLQDLWVDGEISNLTIARSGHAYFTLKDETCQFPAVMWRAALARQQMVPREGDRVIAHGDMTFYQPRGAIQIQVDLIQPQGAGMLQLRLEQLRQKLEAEGLFDPSRKRPLPAYPTRIGVVTSSSGAVWHDIQQVVARRYPLAELILAPASVQGEEAPESIVAALTQLQDTAEPDVIIVGRGGGSLEDLWAFNDERVVRAIFAARVPIIAAIGHETDVTLADYVADVRAPTPSAAAELAAPDLLSVAWWLEDSRQRLTGAMEQHVGLAHQFLDDLQLRLTRGSPAVNVVSLRRELEPLAERMQASIRHRVDLARHDVVAMGALLHALDPQGLLCRGFSFVCDPDTGSPIRLIDETLGVGDRIRAMFADGAILADVTHIERTTTT